MILVFVKTASCVQTFLSNSGGKQADFLFPINFINDFKQNFILLKIPPFHD